MPKRVIDFDAMWASDKLAACAEWAQAEYAWLYGLADCAGCFELTNLRVIWGRVAAVRRNFSIERLEQVIDEFHDKRLLFIWTANGKRYGHWTGSDVPGRLPPPSWRNRLERLAPPVPREQVDAFLAEGKQLIGADTPRREPGGSGCLGAGRQEAGGSGSVIALRHGTEISRAFSFADEKSLKPYLDSAQAQDLDLDLEGKCGEETHTQSVEGDQRECEIPKSVCESAPLFEDEEKAKGSGLENNSKQKSESSSAQLAIGKWSVAEACPESRRVSAPQGGDRPGDVPHKEANGNHSHPSPHESEKPRVPTPQSGTGDPSMLRASPSYKIAPTPESLAEIWEQERGTLSELRGLTPDRIARCRERIRNATQGQQFLADFREAVRRAAATPFLCGSGPAGWRANFDWIVANDTNYLKVLEGRYDAGSAGAGDAVHAENSSAHEHWSARSSARDDAARRMARAGAGPEAPPSVRVRSDVLNRALHRA